MTNRKYIERQNTEAKEKQIKEQIKMALDQKTREADRAYEEFEPPIDWDHDEASDTLILTLPGFKKEQVRVQVITSTRVVRVSGERQISENKWRRFRKEMTMPSHSDTSRISATIEAGMLYVRLPKMIITNNNNNKQQQQQQQSPNNNAPTPKVPPSKPPQPAPTPTPKKEAPNPHPLQRIASYLKPSNRQKKPIVDEYLYKASEFDTLPDPGIDKRSSFYVQNIHKRKLQSPTNNAPTPKVPPTKPPQPPLPKQEAPIKPQQPTTDHQKAAAEPPQKVEKGKARILTDDDIVNKQRSVEEGAAAAILKHGSGGGSDHDHGKVLEKRSLTMEMVSQQSQEYMNAVSGLAEEVRKLKKLVKLQLLTFLVLLFGVYVLIMHHPFEGTQMPTT